MILTAKNLTKGVYEVWSHGSSINPLPAMKQLNSDLKNQGIVTAILSSTVKPKSDLIRSSGGYKPYDYVFLSDELHLSKPDELIYTYVLTAMNAHPNYCLFIDDQQANLGAAESLGMTVIHATGDVQQMILNVMSYVDSNS